MPLVKALWSYRAYKPFWFSWAGDLEIRSRSLNVKLEFQISVMHMSWKTKGPKLRRYEVIALTSHFGLLDLLTLKLGQDH